jgi:hypothetical protein
MTFHTPSQYGDMNTSDKTICPGCGHDQNKHWTNGCIFADCICRKHDINEDAPEYEGLKRNGTSQIGDKTELNLCSVCNTMKNIPIGETVCARCKTDDSLTIFSLFSKYSEPCLTEDEHIIAYDDFETDLKALVQAERIKAKHEVLTAQLHGKQPYHAHGGVKYIETRFIEEQLAELDTPKGEE